MNVESIYIGIILLVLCIVPFVIVNYIKGQNKKRILKSLKNIARQHNCQIGQHELFGNFIIGLDENKNAVLFYKMTKNNTVEQHIELEKIQSCKVINTNKTNKSKTGHSQVFEKYELSFIPIDKSKAEITLEFYDEEESLQPSGEVQIMEKWSNLINNRLKVK
ncbi:MAG: hypothetical protein PHT69_04185 [Bacteroidales bacterium]|nr:hypothetical protein [Bacteroidales bacterium]